MYSCVALVHGNPETAAVWDLLADRLSELGHIDLVRLSPPGFGSTVPDRFDPGPESYRCWLVDQLEALPTPVHLVGHDLGGLHAVTVAMTRPDLIRSWCSDVLGAFHPAYAWHDLARRWQRSPDGERFVEERLAQTAAQRAHGLVGLGVDPRIARRLGAAYDTTMASAVLGFYRAAAQPALADLGRGLEAASARPGLAIVATEDRWVGTERQQRECADRAGAEVGTLPGLGHWWMTQEDGRPGAEALHRFWTTAR